MRKIILTALVSFLVTQPVQAHVGAGFVGAGRAAFVPVPMPGHHHHLFPGYGFQRTFVFPGYGVAPAFVPSYGVPLASPYAYGATYAPGYGATYGYGAPACGAQATYAPPTYALPACLPPPPPPPPTYSYGCCGGCGGCCGQAAPAPAYAPPAPTYAVPPPMPPAPEETFLAPAPQPCATGAYAGAAVGYSAFGGYGGYGYGAYTGGLGASYGASYGGYGTPFIVRSRTFVSPVASAFRVRTFVRRAVVVRPRAIVRTRAARTRVVIRRR